MVKTRKITAILVVICLTASFPAFSASADVREPDYTINTGSIAAPVDLTPLFLDSGTIVLYPGEKIDSVIRVINDSPRVQTITVSLEKGKTATEKNLADLLDLKIKNGTTGEIYTDERLADIENFATDNIRFLLDGTTDFTFVLTFNNNYFKDMNMTQEQINEYMSAEANFKIIFAAADTAAPYLPNAAQPDGEAGEEAAAAAAEPAAAQPSDALAEEPSDTSDAFESAARPIVPIIPTVDVEIPDEKPAWETAAEEEYGEEEYDFEDGGIPLGNAEFETEPNASEPGVSETADGGPAQTTQAATETTMEEISDIYEEFEEVEVAEDIEDREIPLGNLEFIDKMPKTGEKTDPLAYVIIGLALVLAGLIAIVIAGKKSSQTPHG